MGARPGDDFCEFDSWPGDYCGCMGCAEADIDMLSRYDDYMEEKMWRSRGSNSEHRFDQRFDQRADPQPSDSSESSNSEYESDPCGSGDYDPDFGIFDDY